MHFSTQFSATTLTLLWGYPFFVRGEGRSAATAGLLLTLVVVAIMYRRPGARLAGRRPPVAPLDRGADHRLRPSSTVWTVVLLWPGNAPLGLLVAATAVVGRRRARPR